MDAKKMFSFLPVIVPVIYVFGYLVTSSYLGRYGINDNSIFNFAYLRSGVLFFLILLSLFWGNYLPIDIDNMTDNLLKAWPRHIVVFSYSLAISIFATSKFVFDFVHYTNTQSIFSFILVSLYVIGIVIIRYMSGGVDYYKLLKYKLIITFSFIILLIVLNSLNNWKVGAFTIMCIVLSLIIALTVGDFGDKNYKSMVFPNLIALILSASFFGYYIYGDVPAKFGGGASYQIVVQDANNTVNFGLQDTVSVVYENNDRLLIVDEKENIMFVDKDLIPIYKIINTKK